ncbi:hypothetical protein DICVIV_06016 [Dictyocaulus viviparus]|uniref:Uncharacterized protein n=1 Tax=Dictyocaulus viviparus TaxID=29172 RepID=A0A0D8XTE9_DICVI|nr:hypothetical protein DICVIV_06016 [Dictyocaulus viviparus]
MGSRPHSREATSFPAGHSTTSSNTSEQFGAFTALPLNTLVHSIHNRSPSSDYSEVSRPVQQLPMQPSFINERTEHRLSIATDIERPSRLEEQNTPILESSYRPSFSIVSSNDTKKRHKGLSDVVSTSDDTNDLRRNLADYLNDRIPSGLVIAVLILLSIVAFVLILIGTFNIPFCPIQPMIPIWLMVTGILIIISSTLRIFRLIPSPKNRRPNLSFDLCCGISEGLLFVTNIVWLTLGCIWVYGSKSRVHFQEYMFEEHYCDSTIFWTAFWICTIYLIIICLLLILLIIIVVIVSSKESVGNEMES